MNRCRHCDGTGRFAYARDHVVQCTVCRGSGEAPKSTPVCMQVDHKFAPGAYGVCKRCGGERP